ncbi:hypothetical protein [Shouchella clausii]|uniref:hypothetical protein n=1 Tax=Shouchella clausii TaxID=79880 RepID=UPI002740EFE7|nr:hypothetical protein [Shouchella clausii]MDP5267029.1 hypothetical protein [Shouchella clausii]
MATISKITVQKKAKQRYNVFIGKPGAERFAFSVDEAILVKYGLRKGLELDENEIKALIEADELKKNASSCPSLFIVSHAHRKGNTRLFKRKGPSGRAY